MEIYTNKKKIKVLAYADKRGWAIGNSLEAVIAGVPCDFTTRYWTESSVEEFADLYKKHDLIYFANWDIEKYMPIFKDKKRPVVMVVDSYRYKPFVQEAARFVDQVITRNPDLATHFPNAIIIPSGLHKQFVPTRQFIVGFAGTPDEYKGYPLIEQACKELGVIFRPAKGELSHEEMPQYYESIDLLVSASIEEGFCYPIIEALSMNTPVISTNVGVARSLNIYKIERNVESIKQGILKYYTRPEILNKFSWEKSNELLYNLICDLVDKYEKNLVKRLFKKFVRK